MHSRVVNRLPVLTAGRQHQQRPAPAVPDAPAGQPRGSLVVVELDTPRRSARSLAAEAFWPILACLAALVFVVAVFFSAPECDPCEGWAPLPPAAPTPARGLDL